MLFQTTSLFDRAQLLHQLEQDTEWDLMVIGGGATGLGIAVDAASRGYRTLLLEQHDFAKGTSSRSTKLVHGGVRYLAQGNIPLVYRALQERGRLLQNVPHVVHKRAFVIPCFSWVEGLKYLVGLKLYDALAGKWSFGKSIWLSKKEVLQHLPGINEEKLKGGVLYFDGQFDDARLAINLAQTALEKGAVVLNHVKVLQLLKASGKVCGVQARDMETGKTYEVKAKTFINATGVFAEAIHHMDMPDAKPLLKQSQGVHLVLDASFLPGSSALMIPKTRDGRVLFVIPWHEHLVVGTTDTPVAESSLEPSALSSEIQFILETLNPFLKRPVTEADVSSVFAGLRPLVLPQKEVVSTKELSRDHKINVSKSGLITIIGGKWTTYRKMAEDAVAIAIKTGGFQPEPCVTKNLRIHGSTTQIINNHLSVYGSDAMVILKSWSTHPGLKKKIHPKFPYTEAEVLWAIHQEGARTVEDVLARRLRLLFLDAKAAIEAAPRVAALLCEALDKNSAWETEQVQQFTLLAKQYLVQTHDMQMHSDQSIPTN